MAKTEINLNKVNIVKENVREFEKINSFIWSMLKCENKF